MHGQRPGSFGGHERDLEKFSVGDDLLRHFLLLESMLGELREVQRLAQPSKASGTITAIPDKRGRWGRKHSSVKDVRDTTIKLKN